MAFRLRTRQVLFLSQSKTLFFGDVLAFCIEMEMFGGSKVKVRVGRLLVISSPSEVNEIVKAWKRRLTEYVKHWNRIILFDTDLI